MTKEEIINYANKYKKNQNFFYKCDFGVKRGEKKRL